jgi:hypothetical protein
VATYEAAPALVVGEGDLRDVEHDPVIAHVLESPFELHRTHPFEPKAGILYKAGGGFKSFQPGSEQHIVAQAYALNTG